MPAHIKIPLAIVIAVLGTFAYSLGIAKQHRSVAGQPSGVGFKQFLRLFTNPAWLMGIVGIGVSAGAHFVALTMAPITVVQPIGVLGIIWSVMLEDRHRGEKSSRRLWTVIAVAALALSVFVLAAAKTAAEPSDLRLGLVLTAAIPAISAAILFAVVGITTKKMWLKTLLCATSSAVVYGFATGLIKTALTAYGRYGIATPWVWIPVASLFVLYMSAAWVLQQSFGAGAASIGVGVMTTADPVMAVIFGLVALGEGANLTPVPATVMAIAGAISVAGIVVLSKMRADVDAVPLEAASTEPTI